MKLGEIVQNFNLQAEELCSVIETVYTDDEIKKYKYMLKTVNKINAIKMIEQYIIHVVPECDKIYNKDEKFFLNLQNEEIIDKLGQTKLRKELHEDSLVQILKMKDIWMKLSEENKNIVWEYFQLLTYYAQEYLKLKLKM